MDFIDAPPPPKHPTGRQTRWWIKETVAKFSQQLERMGSRLIIRRSQDSVAALQQLVQETGAEVRARGGGGGGDGGHA